MRAYLQNLVLIGSIVICKIGNYAKENNFPKTIHMAISIVHVTPMYLRLVVVYLVSEILNLYSIINKNKFDKNNSHHNQITHESKIR